MAYTRINWLDRAVEFVRRYRDQNNNQYTFTPDEGSVYCEGTPVTASTMNKMDLALYLSHNTFTTAGTANAYTVTIDGITTLIYLLGIPLKLKMHVASPSNGSTLSVNGLTASALRVEVTKSITTGDWVAGQIIMVIWDGSYFQVIGEYNRVNKNGDLMLGGLTARSTGQMNQTTGAGGTGFVVESQTSDGTTPAMMMFHRPGSAATYFGYDTDNQFKFGGYTEGAVKYKFWTEKNDGYGSGLLADDVAITASRNAKASGFLSDVCPRYNGDLNAINYNSEFNIDTSTTTNEPDVLANSCWAFIKTMVHTNANNFITQILYGMNGISRNRVWMRHCENGTWYPWTEVGGVNWIETTPQLAIGASGDLSFAASEAKTLVTVSGKGIITDLSLFVTELGAMSFILNVDGVNMPLSMVYGPSTTFAVYQPGDWLKGASSTSSKSVQKITGPIRFKSSFVLSVKNNSNSTVSGIATSWQIAYSLV